MDSLALRPLTRRQIDQAFALVRGEFPDASAARWRDFALARSGGAGGLRERGIMTLQNQGGYILGLFVFDVRDDLRDGRTLIVSHAAIPELVGRASLARQLVDGAVTVAQLNDCRVIDVAMPEDLDADLAAAFRDHGFGLGARHGHAAVGSEPLASRLGAARLGCEVVS